MTPTEQMVISALRYALDRRSYIMSVTEEYIREMLKGTVSENFLKVCIDDISYEIAERERLHTPNGGLHDWASLKEDLMAKMNS